jgi:hypothetical protein
LGFRENGCHVLIRLELEGLRGLRRRLVFGEGRILGDLATVFGWVSRKMMEDLDIV